VTAIPRDAYGAAAQAIMENADATLTANAVQLGAAILTAVAPYFAAGRGPVLALGTDRRPSAGRIRAARQAGAGRAPLPVHATGEDRSDA